MLIGVILTLALQEADFQKRLDTMAVEVAPLVEKEAGRKFKAPVTIKAVDRTALKKAIQEESVRLNKVIFKKPADNLEVLDASEYAAERLHDCAPSIYRAETRTVIYAELNLIDRRTVKDVTERIPLVEDAYLRILITQDLAYALVLDSYKIGERRDKTDHAGEFQVAESLARGYAQFLTRKIAKAEGKETEFERVETFLTSPFPPSDKFKDRIFYKVLGENLRLAYVDAEVFFSMVDRVVDKTIPGYDWVAEAMDQVAHAEEIDDPKIYLRRAVRKKKE